MAKIINASLKKVDRNKKYYKVLNWHHTWETNDRNEAFKEAKHWQPSKIHVYDNGGCVGEFRASGLGWEYFPYKEEN